MVHNQFDWLSQTAFIINSPIIKFHVIFIPYKFYLIASKICAINLAILSLMLFRLCEEQSLICRISYNIWRNVFQSATTVWYESRVIEISISADPPIIIYIYKLSVYVVFQRCTDQNYMSCHAISKISFLLLNIWLNIYKSKVTMGT